MKNFTKLSFIVFLLSAFSFHYAISQTSPLKITVDGDLHTGGDLDYRDATGFGAAFIDFDGIDDYVEASTSQINNLDQFTISFWVKPESFPIGDQTYNRFIMGQKDGFEIWTGNQTFPSGTVVPTIFWRAGFGRGGISFNPDVWTHITFVANLASNIITIYRNGFPISNFGASVNISNANPFRIGSREDTQPAPTSNFEGWLDEIRIFDSILTSDQIQRMIYQEIENNAGNVRGCLTDKDIVDISTNTKIPWTNLICYYTMNNVQNNTITDQSLAGNDGAMFNITNILPQSAPMPYETVTDGDWNQESTWLHGDVWDIEDIPSNKRWSIVRIKNDVTTSASHTQLGMLIDPGSSLSVSGDQVINNTWYLQLDGTLDLQEDSQLIQGINSDLVTSATGNILRRQEGNSSVYWYNYWSSPVGSVGATTLTNNNAASNNSNNTTFNIAMLKDESGDPFTFTSSFDDPGNISNRWLYSYQNGQTFWDWTALTPASPILPGVGYTQKGTGNAGTEQQYIFDGKPNNGTILVEADDVDGDSANESEQDVTLTTTFVGNPYPSAIDAREFIMDNNGVTGGSVYVWEQWGGTNHILEDYQGGYGTINMATTEKAYQFNDPTQTESPLARKPTFYIPVAQGFFVEVVNDGDNGVLSTTDDIEFNNGQRIFIRESDADGTNPNNGSEFFRSAGSNQEANEVAEMDMIRLELNVSNGNSRSFVLAFSDQTTDGFDYGYDARTIDPQDDDMNSFIGDQKMLIQSFSPITDDKVIDLMFNSTGTYDYTLEITEFNGIDEDQDIYLRDNLTNTYFNLRNGAYSFSSSTSGEDSERFDIVFQDQTLSTDDIIIDDVVIFTSDDKLFIKGLNQDAKSLSLTNMLGQTITSLSNITNNTMENGIGIQNLSTGVYIVNITTSDDIKIDGKVVVN